MNFEGRHPGLLVTLAILAGLTCQLLLGTSYVAASLDPLRESRGIPIAFVTLDTGERGRELRDGLLSSESVVLWTELPTRAEALAGLDQKSYYGAIVIPESFTTDLESFASQTPRAAHVETYSNPGASTAGSIIASRAIEIAIETARTSVREQAIAGARLATTELGALTLDQARFIAQPITVTHAEVNPVPPGGANGLAPTYFAMAAWIGGYIGAVALERFRPQTRLSVGARSAIVLGASVAQGLIATFVAMAIGFAVRDAFALAILVALGTWMAYALVSLLMDVFGLAGILPAFAVLAVGLPAAGALYPRGVLPDLYQTLHAASPFTWLVEGLRTVLYAPAALDLAPHARSLVLLALGATAASLALAFAREQLAKRRSA